MRGEECGPAWPNQSRLGSNLAVLGLKVGRTRADLGQLGRGRGAGSLDGGEATHLLTLPLLCIRLFGYALKLSKASAGPSIKWIGAKLTTGAGEEGPVQDKVSKLRKNANFVLLRAACQSSPD